MKRGLASMALLPALLLPAPSAANSPITFYADLQSGFLCSTPPQASRVAYFLRHRGFRAADLRVLRQWRGGLGLIVDSYDARQWQVTFFGPSGGYDGKGWYDVQVFSPAPTHHDTELENRVLDFISHDLGCELRQTERHDAREGQERVNADGFVRTRADVDAALQR